MLSVCVVPSVGQGPELNEKDTVNWNQHYLFCASWLQMQSGYLPQAPLTMTDCTLRLWAKVNISFLNLPLFKTIIYLLWCVWWGIERNCKSVLSYHVGLKNQTQVAVLGSAKSSYTTGPSCWVFHFHINEKSNEFRPILWNSGDVCSTLPLPCLLLNTAPNTLICQCGCLWTSQLSLLAWLLLLTIHYQCNT